MSASILQFLQLNSVFQSQFWFSLAKLKLESWKLDDSAKEIFGFEAADSKMEFNSKSFEGNSKEIKNAIKGILKNTNTIEEFRDFDKKKFQEEIAVKVISINNFKDMGKYTIRVISIRALVFNNVWIVSMGRFEEI